MDEDTDRICAEFHATHDPYGAARAAMRLLSAHITATFSDLTIYDRAGRKRAREEWLAHAPPEVLERVPLKRQVAPPRRSFAGKHLSWDSSGALEVCQIVARDHPTRSQTWVAREAAKILHAQFVSRPTPEIVEITWRGAKMPVSATGASLADPTTGAIVIRCDSGQVSRLRQDIEAAYGPISHWSKTVVQERDPITFDHDPDRVDDGLFRQLKRLVKQNGVGQPD
jgi:hypothetical protein